MASGYEDCLRFFSCAGCAEWTNQEVCKQNGVQDITAGHRIKQQFLDAQMGGQQQTYWLADNVMHLSDLQHMSHVKRNSTVAVEAVSC